MIRSIKGVSVKYVIFTILLTFSANSLAFFEDTCDKECQKAKKEKEEFKVKCVSVGHYLRRCENKEVICYHINTSTKPALQCKFKD